MTTGRIMDPLINTKTQVNGKMSFVIIRKMNHATRPGETDAMKKRNTMQSVLIAAKEKENAVENSKLRGGDCRLRERANAEREVKQEITEDVQVAAGAKCVANRATVHGPRPEAGNTGADHFCSRNLSILSICSFG